MTLATPWMGVALASVLAGPARAQSTERVSVDSAGVEGNERSYAPAISDDGRCVDFMSFSSNLVSGDTNAAGDAFVREHLGGTTLLASLAQGWAQGNNGSGSGAISSDGRFVVFQSLASNLVAGDTNAYYDIFVRDRLNGTTERVSVDSSGLQGNNNSWERSAISADGRFVAFMSIATNLVAGDTNGFADVFLHDRATGTTERISVDSAGIQGNSASYWPSVSGDGRCVAFYSVASNLVAGDSNGTTDVFVRDRLNGTTERISLDSSGTQANNASDRPAISADARYVAFRSAASNLVAGDTNWAEDIFVRDRVGGTTERVSLSMTGAQGNAASPFPSISGDGRFVAFRSSASNLVVGDTNGFPDIFVRDRLYGTTERVSIDSNGLQGNEASDSPAISANGRFVAFESRASNLVPGDTNAYQDIFLHDRGAGFLGMDLCQAGTGSVGACPCSNPPSNSPRGCDNSASTGGARLASSGSASVGSDSVMFLTNGEKPSATSIVLQGDLEVTNGLGFGQGVRCLGGALKRLYVKTASGGSITAPGPGDPPVSARSAALGDPISAGTNRWYAVYYRDPVVLGNCPATSTYNITQTQLIAWGA